MKKVLLVSSAYKGGEKTHLDQLIAGLSAHHRFTLLTPARCPSPNSTFVYSYSPIAFWKTHRFIQKNRFDSIHCHGFYAMTFIRLIRLMSRHFPRIICTIHGFHIDNVTRLKKWLRLLLEKGLARRQDHTIAVSQSDYNTIASHLPQLKNHMHLIENGLVTTAPTPQAIHQVKEKLAEFGIDIHRDYLVLSIGALEPIKDHATSIKAARLFADQSPEARLKWMIFGKGPEKKLLEKMIATLNLNTTVYLAGQSNVIPAWLSIARCLVIASKREGSPYAILEAMSMDTPIISANVAGCRDIISHHKNGLLFQKETPKSLANALQELHKNPNLNDLFKHTNQHLLKTRFSLTNMLKKTNAIYEFD